MKLSATPTASTLTFKDLAQHFIKHELDKVEGQIGRKAAETAERDKHNLEARCIERWGDTLALDIKPTALELWYELLSSKLSWPTVSKVRSVMSRAFNHGYRHGLLPGNKNDNPIRLSRCRTVSDYEALTVTTEQMISILSILDTPTSRLEWTLALTCAATGMRGEDVSGLKWKTSTGRAGGFGFAEGGRKDHKRRVRLRVA